MIKSIIITALRNMFRNRAFSLINLIGLSVGMSLSLLIILIVREQYTYDRFHADAERIYRVNTRALRTNGGSELYASTPLPIAGILKDEYTFTEEVVRMNRQLNADAIFEKVNVPVSGLFVDPSFFKVFNFQVEKGNPATMLNEPNSLVLTQETAKRIFGDQDPFGKTLSLSGYGEFTVTGLLKQSKEKTHLDFQMLASAHALPLLEKQGIVSTSINDWNNYYAGYVYFKLRPGHSITEVEEALTMLAKKYYKNIKLETRDRGYEFYIHPLTAITPGPVLSNQMGRGLPNLILVFLGSLATIIMVMSCFNFTNLMIAKSLSRSREIGVRKVVGAQRYQVFLQFVGESVVFCLVALVFSYLLMQFLKTGFLELPLNQEFALDLKEDIWVYGWFILFAIVVGVIAGLLPAGYLSAFKAIRVLKDAGNLKVYSRLTLRKTLMVAQFTLSVIFVVVVLVINNQIRFMLSADYGFQQKNILNVRLQGIEYAKLERELQSFPGVVSIGGVSNKLGTWSDNASDYKKDKQDEPFVMRDFTVNENYVNNLKLQFVAGHNFDASSANRDGHVILNENALPAFGFTDPRSAIGQTLYVDDSVMLSVIGVVKDFHFRPLNTAIGPLALRYSDSDFAYLSAKIDPRQKQAIVSALEATWKKLDPIHPIEWMMMEEEIDDAYRQAGMHDVLIIVGYITFIAVTLACLGMLGMAMYTTQTRVKEIGVRKVMGASVSDIVYLLSRSFLLMIGLAIFIGVPVSFLLGDLFLSMYAYRIEITPLLLFSGSGIIASLGLLMICSQTMRAALSDPVKSLRYE
jgi:putative ABC transport system permease protein